MFKEDLKKMSKKKIVRLIILAILAVVLWQVSIPVIIVWLIFKKTKLTKNHKLLFSIVVVFIYMGVLGSTNLLKDDGELVPKQEDKTEAVSFNPQEEAELRVKEIAAQKQIEERALKIKMEKAINDLKDYKTPERKEVLELRVEAVLFSIYADDVSKAKLSSNDEIVKIALELETILKKIQVKEFPAIRKQYGELMRVAMWESDIDVKVSGPGNSVLSFTGGIFAANKNKSDFQSKISDVTDMLRFKKVEYRWYSGDNGSYYENDKVKDDNEL